MRVATTFACILLLQGFCFANDREPAVAGKFYPVYAQELSYTVDVLLKSVPFNPTTVKPIVLLVPHAGYTFSGKTAACSYMLVAKSKPKVVILLGSSHNNYFNYAAVYPHGNFITPLGPVKINSAFTKNLLRNTHYLKADINAHKNEHAIEVQLPFLQMTLQDFTIVPIMIGQLSRNRIDPAKGIIHDKHMEIAKIIGQGIARTIKEMDIAADSLIIASSDLSHYARLKDAEKSDLKVLDSLLKLDPYHTRNITREINALQLPNMACALCSEDTLYAAIFAAIDLGADKAEILGYSNSADASKDPVRVVGYGSAVFFNKKTQSVNLTPKGAKEMEKFSITPQAQELLLKIARQSVSEFIKAGRKPNFDVKYSELMDPAAVFVTLTKNKSLRGCIGTTTPHEPLYKAVSNMAIAAAFHDNRFAPMAAPELKNVKFEISVLSPLTKTTNTDEIIQGVHGVVVRRGGRSGLFLPQVWNHFKTKEAFLNELCSQKAGLSPSAWKDPGTELHVFTVVTFEEK